MDDNVVTLFPTKNEVPEDKSLVFTRDVIIPWLSDNGADFNNVQFKYQVSTILTCLQGLINV